MDTHVDRWLILEQESDRSLWRSDSCDHLFWNSSTLRPESRLGLPRHIPTEREICILFLPVRHGTSILPETFSNRSRWQWNVWCHYGRDISMAELRLRWRSYERLAERDKAQLSSDSAHPPLPFSRTMAQPWSAEFHQLKKLVRQGNTASFEPCLNLLKKAMMLATGTQRVQQRFEQAQVALPAVLAARYLLESLPTTTRVEPSSWPTILEYSINLYRHSGLMAMAERKERFSGRMRDAYRYLEWTMVSIRHHQQVQDKLTQGSVDLMRLRWALIAFINAAEDEATTTSQALIKADWDMQPNS